MVEVEGFDSDDFEIDSYLADHRFKVSEESKIMMRDVEKACEQVRQKYPFVMGVSFFGSRIIGRERPDSDIDYVLFIDIDKVDELTGELTMKEVQDKIEEELRTAGVSAPDCYEWTCGEDLLRLAAAPTNPLTMQASMEAHRSEEKIGMHRIFFYFFLSNSPEVIELRNRLIDLIKEHFPKRSEDILGTIVELMMTMERSARKGDGRVEIPYFGFYEMTMPISHYFSKTRTKAKG